MATTKKPAKPAKPASAKSATKATSSKRVTPLAKPKAPATKSTTKKPAAKKAETKAPAKSKAAATKPATTKATTKKPATKKAETKAPVKSKATATKPATTKATPKKSAAKKAETKAPVKSKPTTAKQTATKATPKKPAAKKAETKAPAKSKPAAAKRTTKQADTATPPPVPPKADKKPTTLKSNYGIIRPSGAKTQKAAAKPTATKSRLSDATLEAFRKRLLADRAAIEAQLNAARSNALRQTDEENQEEDGSNSFNRAADLNRADDQHKRLRAIDDALLAIKEKTYGICSMCGKPIPRDRLEAAPFAIRCVACKEIWEKTMAKERNQSL